MRKILPFNPRLLYFFDNHHSKTFSQISFTLFAASKGFQKLFHSQLTDQNIFEHWNQANHFFQKQTIGIFNAIAILNVVFGAFKTTNLHLRSSLCRSHLEFANWEDFVKYNFHQGLHYQKMVYKDFY